jgi:hypothetical protein
MASMKCILFYCVRTPDIEKAKMMQGYNVQRFCSERLSAKA